MKYRINGVIFTEEELSLLCTFKHMIADADTDANANDVMELPCNLCESQHIRVIQELAAWFLKHPSSKKEECVQMLKKSTRKHNVDSCSDLLLLCIVFDYVNFQLLEEPLQCYLASSLPLDSKELLSLFRQEGETLHLDQKIATDIMELARVLPHSDSLQRAKIFLTNIVSSQTETENLHK